MSQVRLGEHLGDLCVGSVVARDRSGAAAISSPQCNNVCVVVA